MNLKSKFVYYLTRCLPKFNWIIIQTFPDWEDNGIALYNYVRENTSCRIIWLTNNWIDKNNIPFKTHSDVIFVKRKSIKGVLYFMFSKYVFFTHGTYLTKYPKNQISVNMWHGFGFKAVGKLNNSNGIETTYALATSKFSKSFMAAQMGIDEEKVLSVGYPRNDRLLNVFNDQKQQEEIKNNLGINLKSRIIVWMPTYRSSVVGDIRNDGIQYNNPFNLFEFNEDRFDKFLKEKDVICLFKPHPMAVKFDNHKLNNLINISDIYLTNRKTTLYQILGITDILVSDLSSVITDFMLTNNPVIHAFSDLECYCESRNLLLNPPQKYLAGPLVETQEQLENEITELIEGTDHYKNKREELKRLFFDNNTSANSTKKLIEFLKTEKWME